MSDVDSAPDTQMIRFENFDDTFAPVEKTSEGGEFLGREVQRPELPEKRKTDTCILGRMKKRKQPLVFPNLELIFHRLGFKPPSSDGSAFRRWKQSTITESFKNESPARREALVFEGFSDGPL